VVDALPNVRFSQAALDVRQEHEALDRVLRLAAAGGFSIASRIFCLALLPGIRASAPP
jgi:hypothetical protein